MAASGSFLIIGGASATRPPREYCEWTSGQSFWDTLRNTQYGIRNEQVKVYSLGEFSKEVCGGPHVARTGELGRLRVVKEEAVGQGVRRIRAVLAAG